MKVVIDIPDNIYGAIKSAQTIVSGQQSGKTLLQILVSSVENGTPLEQTDGDLISRQAVLDIISDVMPIYTDNYHYILEERIKDLSGEPSAEKTTLSAEKTTITDTDLISRSEAIKHITAEYNRRLPVDGLKLAYIEKALNEVEGVTK